MVKDANGDYEWGQFKIYNAVTGGRFIKKCAQMGFLSNMITVGALSTSGSSVSTLYTLGSFN